MMDEAAFYASMVCIFHPTRRANLQVAFLSRLNCFLKAWPEGNSKLHRHILYSGLVL